MSIKLDKITLLEDIRLLALIELNKGNVGRPEKILNQYMETKR